jgi:hypothetical protein
MTNTPLDREREETKLMIQQSSLEDERKQKYLQALPEMDRSQLAQMRLHLKELMLVDAGEDTINEMIDAKQVPDDDDVVMDKIYDKVFAKQEKISSQARAAVK